MRVVYPGSFNPWHAGHQAVVGTAVDAFGVGNVVVAQLRDLDKPEAKMCEQADIVWYGTLVDLVKEQKFDAVIRGLRDPNDFIYEQKMQYWNEDLGLKVPVLHIICPRNLVHVSSSAIRQVEKLGFKNVNR